MEFLNENAGLLVAEVDLEHEDQTVQQPAWAHEKKSTDDPRYFNANPVRRPYARVAVTVDCQRSRKARSFSSLISPTSSSST